jgi:PepSY-associated TM region
MLIHRWMGVVFCVLFLTWFVSGMVMMYCRFPRVEAEDRLARAPALDPSRIGVSPDPARRAVHSAGAPSQIRLNVLDGRPVYRFGFGRRSTLIYADDGQPVGPVRQEMALRIAAAWTGFSPATAISNGLITKDDRWMVYSSVRLYGPFWKYSWPNGEEVYVSRATGEVVHDTTRASRIGAYFGAIPHWLYFTWLRSQASLWTQVVIWLSGVGTVMSLLGLVAGVWLYSPSKRHRFPSGAASIPFAGQKRWHVALGLIFGLFTCTWVLSGLMSMGPFALVSDEGRPNLDRALRGNRLDLTAFAAKDPSKAIAEASAQLKVNELELGSFAGEAFYIATQWPRESLLVPMRGGALAARGTERLLDTIKRVVAPAEIATTRLVNNYELYHLDRQNSKPLPVLYVELNDASQSAYYIDPASGRVVQSYGKRSRWNRWLYHGLHSMDLPSLYAHRPAWDIVVLFLMLGGTALCITSLFIVSRRVRSKLFRRTAPKEAEIDPTEVIKQGAIL